jgi:hypothetical protein
MKKLFACLAAVCVLTGGAFAAGGDASEAGVSNSPLKIWSSGIGFGGLFPLSDPLDSCGKFFGKVVWLNSFDFTEHFALSLDFNYYINMDFDSWSSFGVDAGGDYNFSPDSRVSPFLGGGVGVQYFDGKKRDSEDAVAGLSLTVHPGIALKVTKTADVKVRVPFHLIIGESMNMGIGLDVGVVFFSRLRNVKSLDY